MIDTLKFGQSLKNLGYDFYSGVPCSYQTDLINYAVNHCDFIMSSNEGDAVATCSGAYLAGKKPVVLMQNSGLGNAVSPLTSLNSTFKIPLLGFVSHRGQPGVKDEPQHKLMGEITTDLLDLMNINWAYLSDNNKIAYEQLLQADESIKKGRSYFFIVTNNIFGKHDLISETEVGKDSISRIQALNKILNYASKDILFFGTTGKTGREMFELKDLKNNFYMIGSMGCVSSLALGLSLNSKKKSIVIDGDGSLLMRMGNLATIGFYKPGNFLHILLDNNSHDSTGGQFTVSKAINFIEVAKNCGYDNCIEIENEKVIDSAIATWIDSPSLTFLYIRISKGSKKNLGRPKVSPEQVAIRFKDFINKKND